MSNESYPPAMPPQQPPQPPWGQPPQWGQQPSWGQQNQWGQPAPQAPWGQQPQWGQQNQWGQAPNGPFPGQQPGQHYVAPPKPGVIPLRPLGLGEILDGAFQAARRNGKAMFGTALLVQAGSTVLSLLAILLSVGVASGNFLNLMDSLNSGSSLSSTDANNLGIFLIGVFVAIAISGFISVIALMVLQGVLVIPVMRSTVNRSTGFKQMWRLAKPRIWTLILLAVIYAVAAVVLIALLIGVTILLAMSIGLVSIPIAILLGMGLVVLSLWITTKLLLAPAAIVVENLRLLRGSSGPGP